MDTPLPLSTAVWRPSLPRSPWGCVALAVGLALSGGSAPAEAQDRASSVAGTVTGSDGLRLAQARIGLEGTGFGALTERGGRFRINGLPAGSQTLVVHAMGYRDARISVELVAGEVVQVAVTLEADPVALAALKVDAMAALPPQLQGFYDRRSRGNGHFFTREQIERMQPRQLTDVLRRVPGVMVDGVPGPFGTSQMVQTGRTTGLAGQRSCPLVYYVNGAPFRVSADIGINNFIRPEDVAGIEVYTGAAGLPPQFNSGIQNSRCGVIVIWTRRGENT